MIATFSITNNGTANLTVEEPMVPAGFSVAVNPVSPVPPGGSTFITIGLATDAQGTKTGEVSFTTNVSSKSPFNFTVTGRVDPPLPPPAAEIEVTGNGNDIMWGAPSWSTTNHTDFGDATESGSTVSRTYTINNIGDGSLVIGAPTVPTGFTVTTSPEGTIAPSGSATLVVRLDTAAVGEKTGVVSFSTNDPDENPFNFSIRGNVVPAAGAYAVPHTLELWDYSNESSPVLAGTMTFTGADTSLTFDDPDIHAEVGTVPVKHATTLSWNGFDWGAHRYTCAGGTNADDPGTAFYQVLIYNKPNVNWVGYPAETGFNKDVSRTFPYPFKFVMKTSGGSVIHTFQMYDGLPINSLQLNFHPQHPGTGPYDAWTEDNNKPRREHWNCAMALPWSQARTTKNAKANWWCGGVTADSLRPSQGSSYLAANGNWPHFGPSESAGNSNGTRQYRYTTKRAKWRNATATDHVLLDPYLDPPWTSLALGFTLHRVGYGYEPGNIGYFEAACAWGGPRFDRGSLPSPLIEVLSDPNHVHLADGTPSLTILQDDACWLLFNHSLHFTGNVATGAPALTINQTINAGNRATNTDAWAFSKTYYYGGPATKGGAAKSVAQLVTGRDTNGSGTDEARLARAMLYMSRDNGVLRKIWNLHSIDEHHSHQFMGSYSGFFNSPIHAWHARHCAQANAMVTNDQALGRCNFGKFPAGWWSVVSPLYDNVGTRIQAYKLMHMAICWWLANDHPHFGITRADIQAEMARFFKTFYTGVIVPRDSAASDNSPYWVGLRRFGTGIVAGFVGDSYGSPNYRLYIDQTCAGLYGIVPLMLMEQTGSMEALMTSGDSQVVDGITGYVAMLDKFAVDGILDAPHIFSKSGGPFYKKVSLTYASASDLTVANMAADWTAVNSTTEPPVGSESFLKDSAGNWAVASTQWAMVAAMWVYGMHRYLRTRFPHARSAAAVAYLDGVFDAHSAYVAAGTSERNKSQRDLRYLLPTVGKPKAPTP